jgi:glycosyltransferase involved in cell wall biosynthesis
MAVLQCNAASFNNMGVLLKCVKLLGKQWRESSSALRKIKLWPRTIAISPDERQLLSLMFVPHYYARKAGLPLKTPQPALFRHFLSKGLFEGISPTPLFQPEIFREREGVADPLHRDLPDLLRWCRTRTTSGVVPTTRFDSVFYLHANEEVNQAGVDPFEHFIRHGLAEGRRPNGTFDPEFYEGTVIRLPNEEGLPLYVHFLALGVERGEAPSAVLAPVLVRSEADRAGGIAAYDRATSAITPWVHAIGADHTQLLLSLFHPYLYDGEGALKPEATGVDRLVHFLETGIDAGIDPGPLFNTIYFETVVKIPKSAKGKPSKALIHFLDTGALSQLVTTDMFDAKDYVSAWADMKDDDIWGFGHFLLAGIFEGRRIDGSERVDVWTLPHDTAEGVVHNWQLFWTEAGYPAPKNYAPQPPLDIVKLPHPDLTDADMAFIRNLFVPVWYARQASLDANLPTAELLAHYLSSGIDADLSPSPLFDPQEAARLSRAEEGEPAMKAWLGRRQRNWPAPTPFFDVEFYRKYYGEFRNIYIDLYEHFIVHGFREQRMPNAIFEPTWYDSAYERAGDEAEYPAYIHYLMFGADRGLAPSRLLLPCFGLGGETNLEEYARLDAATRPVLQKLTPDRLQALFAIFMPHGYDGGGELSAMAGGLDRLVHFLESGLDAGLTPGPFFDVKYYTDSLVGRKILASRKEASFLHYLRNGWSKRIVPNEIFDEDSYRAAQPDIRDQNVWGFRHFINHGIFEGRKIDSVPSLTVWPRFTDIAGSQLANWQMFWGSHSEAIPAMGLPGPLLAQQKRLVEIVESDLYDEIIRRAQAIDPALGEPRKLTAIYAAPFHDQLADVLERIYERLPQRQYDSIITVPWLRTGGADLVACQLAAAVKEARPDESVLILLVDQKNFERADWIPEGVDHAHISDLLNFVSNDKAEVLLYTLFLGLTPRRLLNVNSYKTWRTFERFGKRLTNQMATYSYLFCWDQTPEGLRVGYPSMFYASTSPQLTGIFTDTNYLRDELIRLYLPPADVAARTTAMFTPSRSEPTKRVCAKVALENRVGKRPRILWAGRLDRQKRFDLVQEIARRMPHADFHCWGDALLDSPPDFRKSPKNLQLNSGFKDYAELPFEDADLWLFTSAWEGMPTILIEIAVRGMAVVASQVGGVRELANDETSFAVNDIDNVDAYVKALQFAIDNPDERVVRAEKLQQLATDRYTKPSYVSQIKGVFDHEG